jgi:hypothetical protein
MEIVYELLMSIMECGKLKKKPIKSSGISVSFAMRYFRAI